jgi:hypothetical protein
VEYLPTEDDLAALRTADPNWAGVWGEGDELRSYLNHNKRIARQRIKSQQNAMTVKLDSSDRNDHTNNRNDHSELSDATERFKADDKSDTDVRSFKEQAVRRSRSRTTFQHFSGFPLHAVDDLLKCDLKVIESGFGTDDIREGEEFFLSRNEDLCCVRIRFFSMFEPLIAFVCYHST